MRSQGVKGLLEKSRRPKTSSNKKIASVIEEAIVKLRTQRKLDARRLQNELIRLHSIKLSLATIHKVLKSKKVAPLKRKLSGRKEIRRYQRNIPGKRVQTDVCKIAPGIYQYTAIDDCTRYKILAIYKKKTAENTLKSLEKILDEMPFAIQRI